MKVLHLWDTFAPGLFDHSYDICREEGLEARLACMHLVDRGHEPGPDIDYVRRLSGDDAGAGLVARVWRRGRALVDGRRFQQLVRRVVSDFDPDVIHFHYGTTAAMFKNIKEVTARPFLISFYGFDISQGLETPRLHSAYQRLMLRNPLVHVLCDEAAERVQALGAQREQIVEANLPLSVELYPDVGAAGGSPFRWLMPARFVEKKGHAIALAAFEKHLDHWPDDRLTCWGYGNSEWLRNRVNNSWLADRVSVIDNGSEGPFDQAYLQRLREHDIVLAPSVRSNRGDDEGGPALTAVLAQVAGKPVIVSNFPGHERSVSDGVEGLVVPQGDAAALAEAMGRLRSNPQEARAMGKAGRERATRAFNRRSYRDALLGWYRRLAEPGAIQNNGG